MTVDVSVVEAFLHSHEVEHAVIMEPDTLRGNRRALLKAARKFIKRENILPVGRKYTASWLVRNFMKRMNHGSHHVPAVRPAN